MINPLKFIQEVKQEAFKVSWPTGKETLTGAAMVVILAIIAAIFFLILDQILKFLLNFILTINKIAAEVIIVSFFFGQVTLETSDLVSFIKSLIFFNIKSYLMAGVEGLEPATSGFGDRRSTN